MMKIPRRRFLRLAAGAAALPAIPTIAATVVRAQPAPARAKQTTPPLAERLAGYADRLRYDDLDAATIERVKSHLIDTLGCGIAAFDERPVRICRDIALAPPGGVSTIIGTDRRTTPDLAAFANGAAFRYYDLNDVYVGRFAGHPSDHIAACLAVAEAERASAARSDRRDRARLRDQLPADGCPRHHERAAGTRRCSACPRSRSRPAS